MADEQVDWSDSEADGETFWALTDHEGSVSDMVDNNGTLRRHTAFDAFGNIEGTVTYYGADGEQIIGTQPWEHADAAQSPFSFTGRYFDKDTGLQNNLNRWYDPKIGRWLSPDPESFAAADANLYRYVNNQPTDLADPSGLGYDHLQGRREEPCDCGCGCGPGHGAGHGGAGGAGGGGGAGGAGSGGAGAGGGFGGAGRFGEGGYAGGGGGGFGGGNVGNSMTTFTVASGLAENGKKEERGFWGELWHHWWPFGADAAAEAAAEAADIYVPPVAVAVPTLECIKEATGVAAKKKREMEYINKTDPTKKHTRKQEFQEEEDYHNRQNEWNLRPRHAN